MLDEMEPAESGNWIAALKRVEAVVVTNGEEWLLRPR